MVSISIGKGQGLTQGLKAYAQYLGYDVSKITSQNWNDTITRLEYIQRDREADNKPSVFSTDNTKSGWQGKMVVKEGNIDFTDAEMESLLASMGLQTKAEGYESWATYASKEPMLDHGSFKLNKDGNKDTDAYLEELEQVSKDYIEIYDENKDGKIDFDEFTIYKNDWFKVFNKNASEQQVKTENEKFERIFNHLNVDNEKDSKDSLDTREIMNFFFCTDSMNPDNQKYDGYVSNDEYNIMMDFLTEKHTKDGDNSDIIQGFLNRHFDKYFKNYKK